LKKIIFAGFRGFQRLVVAVFWGEWVNSARELFEMLVFDGKLRYRPNSWLDRWPIYPFEDGLYTLFFKNDGKTVFKRSANEYTQKTVPKWVKMGQKS
jgi:hypothetical protein